MKKPFPIDLHNLPARMILSFTALAVLTAAFTGLPAIWLIGSQLRGQAWERVNQGLQATRALHAAAQEEVGQLAMLAAQRPTLGELLAGTDPTLLLPYLETLHAGMELDLLIVCDLERRPLAHAGEGPVDDLCAASAYGESYARPAEAIPRGWLLASYPVTQNSVPLGWVVAGRALDDRFAAMLRDQTSLQQTLWADGQIAASSFSGDLSEREPGSAQPPRTIALSDAGYAAFSAGGRPFYAARFPLDSSGLENEIALDVTAIAAARRRLVWTLVGGMLAAAVVGSILGGLLGGRITRPLGQLARAAATLSQGDLSPAVVVEADLREVTAVAQALERARSDLQRNLDELQQERAWSRHLLEAIAEGIVTLDRFGHIVSFSQGAERITGWRRDQVVDRSCDEVFQPAGRDEPFSQLIPTPGQQRKITLELANGRQATLAFTGARLMPPEAGTARVALVFRDVSEEEAVHRLLAHFLADASHEFRTPLSALAASIELLLDQAPTLSPAELQELLTSLHLGILGLQKLVDNLLESANIEAGQFRVYPRPAALDQIVTEAVRMVQPLLDKHGQRLQLMLPETIPSVQVDPRRTVQVLINLLSNANKYGPEGAEIAIRVDLQERAVRVAVVDQGPGIPAEHQQQLFRRFAHLAAGQQGAPYGVGLGLSVVKAIVEAQGGRVGMENRPEGGAEFWFTLPLSAPPAFE